MLIQLASQNEMDFLDGHKAKQINKDLCLSNDLILVMEKQIVIICDMVPEVRGKLCCLGIGLKTRNFRSL